MEFLFSIGFFVLSMMFAFAVNHRDALRRTLRNIADHRTKEGEPPITNHEYRKFVDNEIEKIKRFL